MKILVINTAFARAQVGLCVDGKLCTKEIDANSKSSEMVLPTITELIEKVNLEIADVDAIGLVVGPGSFTGVRVGVALVKGICAVFPNIKVYPINSLDLMAYSYEGQEQQFCTVMNALSGRFFVKTFCGEQQNDAELVANLPNCYKIGLKTEELYEMNDLVEPTVQNLVEYTTMLIKKNAHIDAQNLSPIYLRLAQAEENLLSKEQNA